MAFTVGGGLPSYSTSYLTSNLVTGAGGVTGAEALGSLQAGSAASSASSLSGASALGWVGVITGAISGVMGAAHSSAMAKEQALWNKQNAEYNRALGKIGYQGVMNRARAEAVDLGLQYRQIEGRANAAMAASGFNPNAGSNAEAKASTELMKQMDLQRMTMNAINEGYGWKVNAQNARQQAMAANVSLAGNSTLASVAGSLLDSATMVAPYWLRYTQAMR